MSVISIYESEVSCLSSILDLQRKCNNEKVEFSTETNNFLLHLTLKKVGPSVAQKVVSKLVAQGEITWEKEEEFEVEQILDYADEDGIEFYLIKWRGWNHAHNSWEPKDNLDCCNLMDEYHRKNNTGVIKAGIKRKFEEIKSTEDDREQKRTRIDELYTKLINCKETMTPLKLISLTSPDKGKARSYRGVISCEGLKVPKFNNTGKQVLNPRSKAYKKKKVEIKKALKDWEAHMNSVITDPAKVTVENDVDLEGPPENFVYINDYKPGPDIEIPNDPVIGCECEECWCSKECCAHQFGVEFAYYKPKRLKLPPGRPIYECNKRCKCGPECSNRVVQQGRKHRVCVFRTSNGRGWGVKALQRIKAGTFVMEYVGEVISSEEAEIRGQTYDAVGRTYLFDLDFNDGDCPFTVDAAVYGNVSHFVNHSCDPNLEVYSVWINTLDPRLPRIALFSRRDIEKGEELTFDYMSSKSHSPLEESRIEATENGAVEKDGAVEKEVPAENGLIQENGTINENVNSDTEEVIVNSDTEKVNVSSDTELVNVNLDTELVNVNLDTEQRNVNTHTEHVTDDVVIVDVGVTPAVTEKGDAEDITKKVETVTPQKQVFASPRKSPKVLTDVYRMVCQCGAKNCRKFVF